MNARLDLLRAHVFAAFDARGTDAFPDACRDALDGYLLWPAIRAELALERARQGVEDREQEMVDAIALMRSTYPAERAA